MKEIQTGDHPRQTHPHQDVRTYLDLRGQTAKVRTNPERALLSHIFNRAREWEWDYTNAPNPCASIKGRKETGRDRYIEDDEFKAVWEKGHYTLQDAMDLTLLTGQRPADVLKLTRADIRNGALHTKQNKTGKKLAIEITGDLAQVIERITTRRHMTLWSLARDACGNALRLLQAHQMVLI